MSQAAAQAVAWQVVTVGVVCLTSAVGWPRAWRPGGLGLLMAGSLASSVFHWPAQGYPMLVLLTLIAWATVWSLIHLSPSAAWIEQSVVWLALANVGYALSQRLGYDPLFDTHQMVGLMGRSNTLGALWLVSVPLARGGAKWALIAAILWLHNWTAMIGVVGLGVWWAWRRWPGQRDKVGGVAGLWLSAAVGWWGLHPDLWTSKALPRVLTWQETLGQALWSPGWGYGLGARSAMTTFGYQSDLGYNVWLEAFHAGGLLILAPCLLVVWRVWRSGASPARTALLLLSAAGCVQSLWHTTGMLVVTLALVAAWELRRMDAV